MTSRQASFTRKDTPEGVVFEVEPANGSKGLVIFLSLLSLFMLGNCSMMAAETRSMPGIVILAPAVLFLWIIWHFAVIRDRKMRKPVTIVANPSGLNIDGQFYPAADIAELYLKSPDSSAPIMTSSPTVLVGGTGPVGVGLAAASASANVAIAASNAAIGMGQVMGSRQRARSITLNLRRKSVSKPEVVFYGLTAEPGRALLNDLTAAMSA